MALVTEDGTGKSDAESYASVSVADAYFSARGITTWTGITSVKEEYLRRGTAYLENAYRGKWVGYRANEGQALAFPRVAYPGNATGSTDILYDADGFEITSTTIPTHLVQAACEAALLYCAGSDPLASLSRGGAIKRERVKAGSVEKETEYMDAASAQARYPVIEGLLRTLVTGVPGASFGSVTIQRG